MKLRFKIFILIGLLFVATFLIAQMVEAILTAQNLKVLNQNMRVIIDEENRYKLKETQIWLKRAIEWEQAETNVLLTRIKQSPFLNTLFSPTKYNEYYHSWLASATLLSMNKRLDYIENVYPHELGSFIILDYPPPYKVYELPINAEEKLTFTFAKDQKEPSHWTGPYLAVPFLLFETANIYSSGNMKDPSIEPSTDIRYSLMYDIDAIMNMDLKLMQERIKAYKDGFLALLLNGDDRRAMNWILREIYDVIAKAQSFLKANPQILKQLQTHDVRQWFEKAYEQQVDELLTKNIYISTPLEEKITQRFNQIEMVWQMAVLNASGIHGYMPFSRSAPQGITRSYKGMNTGEMIMAKDVFYPKPLSCIHPNICAKQADSSGFTKYPVQVIFEPSADRLFFGNTLYLEEKAEYGALTLAIDADFIIKELATTSHRNAFFISDGKIFKGFAPGGDKLDLANYTNIPIKKMLSQTTGIVIFPDGKEYYFLHMQPYSGLDFHFVLTTPLSKEFAIINEINKDAHSIFKKISIETYVVIIVALIVLIFLAGYLSNQITKPIRKLAKAASYLKDGDFESIHLPPLGRYRKDEISELYLTFNEMVSGIREKERVKGVLNKVVSPTIAEEILKGNVQLGGEEKVVTVLFADIRRFTEITEKMSPHDLIQMLNTCMTKISVVIDKYGGVIDKFVGDEVMALFGAPLSSEDSALKAIECAIEMQHVIDEWNNDRINQHLPSIQMGIGIHTGVVILGNMGAENRLNYTVLGANVNLAARLCSAATEKQILVSQSTVAAPFVQDNIEVEKMEPIGLKGFSEPISVFLIKSKKLKTD